MVAGGTEISEFNHPVVTWFSGGKDILSPFQNIDCFGFSRFIMFAKHLDITYV